jgi:hypothetical protein
MSGGFLSHKKSTQIVVAIFLLLIFGGWGNIGHEIINKNAPAFFPSPMSFLQSWSIQLGEHASDADYRKSSDPNESPRHYIDIDNYPEFNSDKKIIQNYDSLVAKHGYDFVIGQGILPWAIINTIDSLQKLFEENDWENALLIAADLGHYVGDSYMPLHLTKNYNGQLSNQYGIHSKYEISMIGKYQNEFQYNDNDSAIYIENIPDYVFQHIYYNYNYVDSVLTADSLATSFAGNTDDDNYYQKLWGLTGSYTKEFFINASKELANLIYTAWVNAGNPNFITDISNDKTNQIKNFLLLQNYPNPFNPTTKIRYQVPTTGLVSLQVYNSLGEVVATLVDEEKPVGTYELNWNAVNLPSGFYFYRLQSGSFVETKKMILMK